MNTDSHTGQGDCRLTQPVIWLTVPTEPGPTYIPLGMSPEDFDLVRASMELWRDRIIKQPDKEPDNARSAGSAESNQAIK